MALFDYRLNPLHTIKECSSCGALYTADYCCSKGGSVDKVICDLNKTLDSSLRAPPNCARCGNPVDGPCCQGCALLRKKLKEVWFTICHENRIYQDLLNTYESSDDNTNVVNAPHEPFVVKQDPGNNSSQSPPHIDHCCYGCGDSLDGIFCQRCTCESCGKGAHIGYNFTPRVPVISKPEPCNNQTVNELPQTFPCIHLTCNSEDENSFTYDSKPNFFMILLTFSTHLRNTRRILMGFVGTKLIMVTIVHPKFLLSIRNRVTIKTLISHKILIVFNNIFIVPIVGARMRLFNVNK
ncbi:hypothetical protein Tco_0331659 [Tanacetum coccineum]